MEKNHLLIQLISFDSEAYYRVREMREKYLRFPLGLAFSVEDLELDRQAYHLVAYNWTLD